MREPDHMNHHLTSMKTNLVLANSFVPPEGQRPRLRSLLSNFQIASQISYTIFNKFESWKNLNSPLVYWLTFRFDTPENWVQFPDGAKSSFPFMAQHFSTIFKNPQHGIMQTLITAQPHSGLTSMTIIVKSQWSTIKLGYAGNIKYNNILIICWYICSVIWQPSNTLCLASLSFLSYHEPFLRRCLAMNQ